MAENKNHLTEALNNATGKLDTNKLVSISKLHVNDPDEWAKYIHIVNKPALVAELSKFGLSLKVKKDFAQIPRLIKLKADVKGLLKDKEGKSIVFNLLEILKNINVPTELMKSSGIVFIR